MNERLKRDTDGPTSFHTANPEGIHQIMHLFSDRGTPASLRHMNAYSGHTYKFTKEVCHYHLLPGNRTGRVIACVNH